ncbi:MAG: TetR/AcrR family transcriptional regulator [Polyangiaceae bacterium]|nr:TetR/AcrR family transcriptional regulator [Polyangiaceae bacterium]MCW5791721.1 TetR/AcrR family transcriptional regulator [Polyangiaceae bacterium]
MTASPPLDPAAAAALIQQIPLRERKFARTKLALMREAMERLQSRSFCEVTVKDLCEAAQVSEATFFNYFPKKEDVLRYFIRIWGVEVTWRALNATGGALGLRFIEELFDVMAVQFAGCPRITMEIIGFMTVERSSGECPFSADLSLAERVQAFPEMGGALGIPCRKLDVVLEQPLVAAIEHGELPQGTPVSAAVTGLLGLFFGLPLVFKDTPEQLREVYRAQLQILWAGLRAAGASQELRAQTG